MIVDRIENAAQYAQQLPHLADALALIAAQPDMDASRHFFPGGFVMRHTGITQPVEGAIFEVHRKYIDVFISGGGREMVLWNGLGQLTEVTPYDEGKDIAFLKGSGVGLELAPGVFCALFPNDGHCAGRTLPGSEPTEWVRYVVKLEI